MTDNLASDTLNAVKQSGKKTLRLKIILVTIFAISSPTLVWLFISLSPLLSIGFALASTVIAILLLLWILKPLNTLIESTKVFSDGNLNHRIDIRSGDEFEEAGNSFNLMAEKIAQTFQQLNKDREIAISERDKYDEILSSVIDGIIALDFNKNIILLNKAAEELTGYTQLEIHGKPIDQTIHLYSGTDEILSKTYCQSNFNNTAKLVGKEGKQTKVNLMSTQIKASVQTNLSCMLVLHDLSKEEELEQMKLDFVSMASHELKTPLTSIVGYISVFLEENKGKVPEESLDLLNKAFTAAKQLQTLTSNLLNVNKIEQEQLSVSPLPLDYLPILTKSIEDLKPQANQKSIVLNLIPPAQPLPKVMADPVRLGEVVTNLVANAINYTNSGGKVEVSTQTSPNEVQTTVADNGVGIPQEAIAHLFGKFFRVSNQLQQANKGTGLGLYISKSIIEKLHGKIWVESEVGKGSRFFFTLPIMTKSASSMDSSQFLSQAFQTGTLNY